MTSKNATARGILVSFAGLSGASLLSISLSILTNKTIALRLGPEGMGVVGLFSAFAASLATIFGSGFGLVVTQRLASGDDRSGEDIIGAANTFILFQAGLTVLCAFFLAGPILRAFFSDNLSSVSILQIRIVIIMAFINTLLQMELSILKADRSIRPQMLTSLATAGSSLLLIMPLLTLGPSGLAINVGSGGFLGVLLGAHWIRKRHKTFGLPSWNPAHFAALKGCAPSSLWLLASQFALQCSTIYVLSEIGQRDVVFLGNFSAALLVTETFMNVAFASARTLAITQLARIADSQERAMAAEKFLTLAGIVGLGAGIGLVWGGPLLTAMLFSSKFSLASKHLAWLAVPLATSGVSWILNAMMVSRGEFRLSSLINLTTAITLALGTHFAYSTGSSETSILLLYVGNQIFGACLYAWAALSSETYRPRLPGIAYSFTFSVAIAAAILSGESAHPSVKHGILAGLCILGTLLARPLLFAAIR